MDNIDVYKVTKDGRAKLDFIFSTFPAGERYVRLCHKAEYINDKIEIVVNNSNSDTLVDILLVIDILNRNLIGASITLDFTYLPYSRQDKIHDNGESLSLSVFLKLLIDKCAYIKVLDMHNISWAENRTIEERLMMEKFIIKEIRYDNFINVLDKNRPMSNKIFDPETTKVLCIDKGSVQRSSDAAKIFNLEILDNLKKTRHSDRSITYDTSELVIDKNVKKIVIFDDICDGGRSFIEIAKILKEKKETIKLVLCVTHGIFSQGLAELKKYFKEIYVDDNNYNLNMLEKNILNRR